MEYFLYRLHLLYSKNYAIFIKQTIDNVRRFFFHYNQTTTIISYIFSSCSHHFHVLLDLPPHPPRTPLRMPLRRPTVTKRPQVVLQWQTRSPEGDGWTQRHDFGLFSHFSWQDSGWECHLLCRERTGIWYCQFWGSCTRYVYTFI